VYMVVDSANYKQHLNYQNSSNSASKVSISCLTVVTFELNIFSTIPEISLCGTLSSLHWCNSCNCRINSASGIVQYRTHIQAVTQDDYYNPHPHIGKG